MFTKALSHCYLISRKDDVSLSNSQKQHISTLSAYLSQFFSFKSAVAMVCQSICSALRALRLTWIGRFIFFALLLIQCGFLVAYPATYRDVRWIPIFLLYLPALMYWLYCLRTDAWLIRMFFTWGLYIMIALIPSVAVVFATAGDDLDKKKFLGPNTLKVILCITPVLFLFLPNTASDLSEYEEYRGLAERLSIQITIDLFDAVEMLDIVLDERQNKHGIPTAFGRAMVAAACFSFLLSVLQLAENKLNEGKHELHKGLSIVRTGVQMIFVNGVFLVIRMVIFFGYGKEESIFIAKNGIAIYLSALQIYLYYKASRSN